MSAIKDINIKKLLLHGLKSITEENLVVQSCELISFDKNEGYDIKVVINGLELEFIMLNFEYYNAFNCKGGVEKIRECITEQIFDLEEDLESEEPDDVMPILSMLKTKDLSWKKMHKRYGRDSEEICARKWSISDEIKEDLERYYPKWIMYNIDESGIHLVRKKDIIKRLEDNFEADNLWTKLGSDIITIHDLSTDDIWHEEANILLSGILKDNKMVSTQFYDFFIGYIISTDKIKWIELDLRRDITLRNYWLSNDYSPILNLEQSLIRTTELQVARTKLYDYDLNYFKNYDFEMYIDELR